MATDNETKEMIYRIILSGGLNGSNVEEIRIILKEKHSIEISKPDVRNHLLELKEEGRVVSTLRHRM